MALYAAVVAEPGAKKTPAFGKAAHPARQRQARLKREYDEAMAEYRREKREWEAEKRRASREEEPVMRRVVVSDITVESLMSRLEQNPQGLLCAKDELSGWVRSLDQYKGGKGDDRQKCLSFWSNSSETVDRKGNKEPIMVPRPFVGLVGSIQPGVLSELKNDREASPSRTKERWARSIVIFMVLLVVGVTALPSLRATVFSDASTAIKATGEEVSFSSEGSSISELPKTGGP